VLRPVELPDGLRFVRSTPEFTAAEVPAGLLREHQLAPSVWGVLRVLRGSLVFVAQADAHRRTVVAGETQVIEPGSRHHIEPSDDIALVIDFYR
jgi:cupin 2 domain-containing protein